MTRVTQPVGTKGSLKWIQQAVAEKWPALEAPIISRISEAATIEWISPLETDAFAEYRDESFLNVLGQAKLIPDLQAFWPRRGPQWDALGRTNRGDLLLVEAKAHIPELCSPSTSAGSESRKRIESSLDLVRTALGVRESGAAWSGYFYQLANRIAHLYFFRSRGVPAWLVFANFVGDEEMNGPSSAEVWRAAYDVAFHVMGLAKRHPLSPFVIDVFPNVSAINSTS